MRKINLKNSQIFCSYRAVNTVHFGYKMNRPML